MRASLHGLCGAFCERGKPLYALCVSALRALCSDYVSAIRLAVVRQQLVEHRVAAQVDRVSSATTGLNAPSAKENTCRPVRTSRPAVVFDAEVRVVDDVADDRGRARDPAAGRMLPSDRSGLCVEGVEVAVVGAEVDGRAEPRRVVDRRRRVDVGARCRWPTRADPSAPRTSRRARRCCPCRRGRTRPPASSRSCPSRSRIGAARAHGPDLVAGLRRSARRRGPSSRRSTGCRRRAPGRP